MPDTFLNPFLLNTTGAAEGPEDPAPTDPTRASDSARRIAELEHELERAIENRISLAAVVAEYQRDVDNLNQLFHDYGAYDSWEEFEGMVDEFNRQAQRIILDRGMIDVDVEFVVHGRISTTRDAANDRAADVATDMEYTLGRLSEFAVHGVEVSAVEPAA